MAGSFNFIFLPEHFSKSLKIFSLEDKRALKSIIQINGWRKSFGEFATNLVISSHQPWKLPSYQDGEDDEDGGEDDDEHGDVIRMMTMLMIM